MSAYHGNNYRAGQRDHNSRNIPQQPAIVMNNYVKKAFDSHKTHDSWSLFFDKFSGYSTKKEPILIKTIEWYEKSEEQLKQAIEQKYALFTNFAKIKNMRFVFLENRSRLLVNMGHSCVLENVGFSFERITGLPYIPGTALKGVVANWALWDANGDAAFEDGLDNFKIDRSLVSQELVDIFGANSNEAEQGKVNFYGIFPLEVPTLKIDIITPHQGRILPNHFLTVDSGTKWIIPIALNRGDEALLDTAEVLIEKCLCNYGVGAKTASGYGKFDTINHETIASIKENMDNIIKQADAKKAQLDEQRQQEQEEANRRADMSEEELVFEDFKNGINNHEHFRSNFYGAIQSYDEQEQRMILQLLCSDYVSIWEAECREHQKALGQNEKKRNKNKAYKRVCSIKELAEKLGVKL